VPTPYAAPAGGTALAYLTDQLYPVSRHQSTTVEVLDPSSYAMGYATRLPLFRRTLSDRDAVPKTTAMQTDKPLMLQLLDVRLCSI
jgi:hypothetical protein